MWLASELVADVKLRAMLPTSSSAPGTADADVLTLMNDELQSRLVPLVMSMNEEFFTWTTTVPLVSGQANYRLPDRASAAKLNDVSLSYGGALLRLQRITPDLLARFVVGASGVPQAFIMEAGGIRLIPTPSAGAGSLQVRYFVRPPRLTITATQWASIVSCALSGTTLSITNLGLGTMGGSLDPSIGLIGFDVVAGRPPFEYLAMDGTCTQASPFWVINFTGEVRTIQGQQSDSGGSDDGGDCLVLRGYSPVPQIPGELIPLLVQLTVARVAQQLRQRELFDDAMKEVTRLEGIALNLLTPRVDTAPRKMRGLMQTGRRFAWFGW